MPLLLLDLDNTLIDRAAAFAAFAQDYVAQLGRDRSDAQWLIEADGDGFVAKDVVAEAVREHFGLSQVGHDEIIATIRDGLVEQMVPEPAVPQALVRARQAGWQLVIVTNGTREQQSRKITTLGLRPYVDGVVISEAAGVSKPDPEIFRVAAEVVSGDLNGAWMIGDSAHADVGGAQAAGIDSVWLSRGRSWPEELPAPSYQAASLSEAVDHILEQ